MNHKSRKVTVFGGCKWILILILLLSIPQVNSSQVSLLDKVIKLEEQQGTVGEILKTIGQAGEITFSYSSDIPVDRWVVIKGKEQTIREFLNELFNDGEVEYVIRKDKILIVPARTKSPISQPTQTIRGKIIDKDSKVPLLGVNVIITSPEPVRGTMTNEQGEFRFEKIPVGWHNIQVSCIGYESATIQNVLVTSGKEPVVTVELEESVINIDEVVVRYEQNKTRPINDMAMISARRFSAEETNYFPGTINDISRVAQVYPGVLSDNDGQNHLIIRGNSPKGLQWRLEGIEFPNLNHFFEIGSSGGGVSILSNNMIKGSDFFTGAFPAEYGNALSGIFDLNLRTGSNEKHEQTFQIGLIGTELMAEGPLKRESNATYIGQYRYSTLKLAEILGINLENIPDFQDISFKFYLPTKKSGTFSIFGIGGKSHETGTPGYNWYTNMGTMGISNGFSFHSKTYIKTIVAFSAWQYIWNQKMNIGTAADPIDYHLKDDITEYSSKISFSINRKINTSHKIKMGIIFDRTFYNSYMGWHSDTLYERYINTDHPYHSEDITYEYIFSDARGSANTLQTYIDWKYRITNNLTLNSGIHFLQFYLNNTYSVEPRLGIQWQFLPKHSLSAGFGIHSKKESLTLYTGTLTLHDGTKINPNINLDLTKSRHYIMGYSYSFSKNLHVIAEAYYQFIYDVPVYPFPPYFSTINYDYGFEGNILVNKGTGYNKGIELTLERLFSDGYSLIINGTLYESKFRNYQEEEYHTKYNGSFAASGLFRKEFNVGRYDQNILGIGARTIFAGGFRYLPIDLEASINQRRQVVIWDHGFTEKLNDFFRIDMQINFRRNKARYTGEWRLDIINVTNHKNLRRKYFEPETNSIEIEYQNPIIPVFSYRIMF